MTSEKQSLPPGQYLTGTMPIVHVGSVPHVEPATWDLRVFGMVRSPFEIDHAAFMALPRKEVVCDLHCVSTWSVQDTRWSGVPLRMILRRADPLPDATHILVHADGGYTTSLTIEDATRDDVLVADRFDGEPLPAERGAPARLLVPHKYTWKSAKWVRAFEFIGEDRPGFWEARGYDTEADPPKEKRFR